MRAWFAFLVGLAGVATPALAHAKDVYVADAAQGADDGSSCADAHSSAWFNDGKNWGSGATQLGAGDVAHLCGTITHSLILQGGGAAGSPLTIRFESGAKLSAPTWTGAWWGVEGAIQATGVSHVVIDGGKNGVIEATDCGSGKQEVGSTGVMLSDVTDVEVENIAIKNMYVRTDPTDVNAAGAGVYGSGGTNVRIHGLHINDAQTGIGWSYPGGATTTGISIYDNVITRINWGIGFGSGDANAIAHDVDIYGNDISDCSNWDEPNDTYHHDGIYPYAAQSGATITGLKIHGNYLHGDIGTNSTAWIYVTGDNVPGDVQVSIYNNLIVASKRAPNDGMITVGGGPLPKIYNNTLSGGDAGGIGINVPQGADVENNIIDQCGTPLGIHGIDKSTIVDYNLYTFAKGGNGLATVDSNGTFRFANDFASWQQSTGLDAHTVVANPMFVAPGSDFHLQAGSPAIDKGTSKTLGVAPRDKDGIQRPQGAGVDIGAYEYCSGKCRPAADGGVSGASPSGSSSGCGCRLATGGSGNGVALLALALGLMIGVRVRRS